jgi:hypothetical protein
LLDNYSTKKNRQEKCLGLARTSFQVPLKPASSRHQIRHCLNKNSHPRNFVPYAYIWLLLRTPQTGHVNKLVRWSWYTCGRRSLFLSLKSFFVSSKICFSSIASVQVAPPQDDADAKVQDADGCWCKSTRQFFSFCLGPVGIYADWVTDSYKTVRQATSPAKTTRLDGYTSPG